jgi:hypothetical protein
MILPYLALILIAAVSDLQFQKRRQCQSLINTTMSEPESNVILFPQERVANTANVGIGKLRVPKTVDEVKTNFIVMRHVHVNEIIDKLLIMMTRELDVDQITHNENLKHSAFFVEALRSMLYKQYNIPHPFQPVAEEIFETEADGTLRLVPKITIKF